MRRSGRKKEWSVALFGIGALAFFPPLLRLYDKPDYVFGIPVSYLVIFGAWALIIYAVARNAAPVPAPPVSDKSPHAQIGRAHV